MTTTPFTTDPNNITKNEQFLQNIGLLLSGQITHCIVRYYAGCRHTFTISSIEELSSKYRRDGSGSDGVRLFDISVTMIKNPHNRDESVLSGVIDYDNYSAFVRSPVIVAFCRSFDEAREEFFKIFMTDDVDDVAAIPLGISIIPPTEISLSTIEEAIRLGIDRSIIRSYILKAIDNQNDTTSTHLEYYRQKVVEFEQYQNELIEYRGAIQNLPNDDDAGRSNELRALEFRRLVIDGIY